MTGPRILIVGAGIAGLATARALHRRGFAVDIVERGRTSEGSGIYLPANALRALSALDLDRVTLGRGAVVTIQRFSDHRGRLLFDVDVGRMWSGVGACLALHRADLHSILLGSISDVPIRMGVQVRDLGSTSGPVTVEFDDGTGAEYDLVVGADGINSSVRHLAFGDAAAGARRVGQLGWRFVTACPAEVTTWSVMLGHRTSFLTTPIGNGRVYCYCDVASKTEHYQPHDLPRLFADFADPVPGLIASVADRPTAHFAPIEEVAQDSWSRGRVLLIGDAAHATSPNMAEGAAMALEDAVVLAECLSHTTPIPAALAAFEARRRPRTNWVRAQTRRRDRIRYLPTTVRNALLRTFGQRIFRANFHPLLAAY